MDDIKKDEIDSIVEKYSKPKRIQDLTKEEFRFLLSDMPEDFIKYENFVMSEDGKWSVEMTIKESDEIKEVLKKHNVYLSLNKDKK